MSDFIAMCVAGVVILAVAVGLWIGTVFIWSTVRVMNAESVGRAELARAEQNRKIAVLEAQADLDAAKLTNQAEIERAKGVAEANRIVGDSLKGNEEYLRYLWINNLKDNGADIIYVPTEAGLPILEAGRSVH